MKYIITMASGEKHIFYNDIETSEKIMRDVVKGNWYTTTSKFTELINVKLIESIVCKEAEYYEEI